MYHNIKVDDNNIETILVFKYTTDQSKKSERTLALELYVSPEVMVYPNFSCPNNTMKKRRNILKDEAIYSIRCSNKLQG
jgi:hypothetical protein